MLLTHFALLCRHDWNRFHWQWKDAGVCAANDYDRTRSREQVTGGGGRRPVRLDYLSIGKRSKECLCHVFCVFYACMSSVFVLSMIMIALEVESKFLHR